MLPVKFGSIWPSSFRGEDFFNISQSETRIALGSHIRAIGGITARQRVQFHFFYHPILMFVWFFLGC
jgi:hypothetical protein